MSFVDNFKKLFGIGPALLFMFLLTEGIAIYANQFFEFNIGLSSSARIIITIFLLIVLLAGMAWFNRTLDLIRFSFMGGDKKLVIKGPFQYVRHPLYSMLIIILPIFVLVWYNDYLYLLSWIIIILASHLLVKFEEKGLIQEFGESYHKYMESVPALIPYKGACGRKQEFNS